MMQKCKSKMKSFSSSLDIYQKAQQEMEEMSKIKDLLREFSGTEVPKYGPYFWFQYRSTDDFIFRYFWNL